MLYDWGTVLSPTPTSADGFVATSFDFSEQMTGPTPGNTTVPDNSSVLNVVATYSGATVNGFELGDGASGNLGTFTLTSPVGTENTVAFEASEAEMFDPGHPNTGVSDSNVTTVTSPLTTPPASTPEPSSLALLGTSVLGVAGMLRRKIRRY